MQIDAHWDILYTVTESIAVIIESLSKKNRNKSYEYKQQTKEFKYRQCMNR